VRTLADKDLLAGKYTNYIWDGMDNNSQPVASGVYFYKLVTKNFNQTKKMVLLK
ncbi:MAG: T9SS type A sorting domain-containing protein, partial [Chitinivibrionia bacterium]|nr:T9SS type A sorting domain-containing protein [Chitinivibrionia bacterium]